jgi:hypothetical protein
MQILDMHPGRRAEYDRVSDVSGTTSSPDQHSGTPQSSISAESPATKWGKKKEKQKKTTTIRQAAAALNLKQFAYNGSVSSSAIGTASSRLAGREREPKKAAASGKVTKAKKPRSRVGREDKLRAKSAFAKAVEHHQRKRARKV